MRVVIQRVLEASVSISGTVTAAIGPGLSWASAMRTEPRISNGS